MRRRDVRKKFFLRGVGVLLLFFTLLSVVHIRKSYHIYLAALERQRGVYSEKQYVEKHLRDLHMHTQRKQYDSVYTDAAREKTLKKIELRGVDLSPHTNRSFSGHEVRFNVIEQ